jgi:hypothetical protein
MKLRVLLLVVLAVLLQACGSEGSAGTASDDVVLAALQKSPTYQALQRSVKRAGFMVDQETEEMLIVDVGENMPERFSRRDTLRFRKRMAQFGSRRLILAGKKGGNWKFQSNDSQTSGVVIDLVKRFVTPNK